MPHPHAHTCVQDPPAELSAEGTARWPRAGSAVSLLLTSFVTLAIALMPHSTQQALTSTRCMPATLAHTGGYFREWANTHASQGQRMRKEPHQYRKLSSVFTGDRYLDGKRKRDSVWGGELGLGLFPPEPARSGEPPGGGMAEPGLKVGSSLGSGEERSWTGNTCGRRAPGWRASLRGCWEEQTSAHVDVLGTK